MHAGVVHLLVLGVAMSLRADTDPSIGPEVLVDTPSGKIRGENFILADGASGARFLGIPYALPPVGPRRFKAPEPGGAWRGTKDATRFGPLCFQPLESDVWDMAFESGPRASSGAFKFPGGSRERLRELRNRIHRVEAIVKEMRALGNATRPLNKGAGLLEIYDDADFLRAPSASGSVLGFIAPSGGDITANATEGEGAPAPSSREGRSGALMMKHKLLADYEMAEDCLTLNIYTPPTQHRSPRDGYPVIVFIHGGSFYSNGGRLYPGERLAAEGLIVVTLNYRLGPFGFLSTGDSVAMGNWGLLDQRLALVWLQKHVGAFRGDGDKILLVGNSAGASSVILQMLSPLSKGLFSRAAALSGCSLTPWSTQRNPLRVARKLASGLRCPTARPSDLVDCLRKVPADDINEEFTFNTVMEQDGLWLSFAPVVEGDVLGAFLPRPPRQLLEEGAFSRVPLIMSLTKDEVTIWFRDWAETMRQRELELWMNKIIRQIYAHLDPGPLGPVSHVIRGFYIYSRGFNPYGERPSPEGEGAPEQPRVPVVNIADLFSDVGLKVPCMEEATILSRWTPTYVAEFSYTSEDDVRVGDQRWIGSYHESDLQYMLGQPFLGLKNSLRLSKDRDVALLSMTIMKSFATQGVPKVVSEKVNITWPHYNDTTKVHLEITDPPRLERGLMQEKLDFWLQFVPLLVKWPYHGTTSVASSTHSLVMDAPVSIATAISILIHLCMI